MRWFLPALVLASIATGQAPPTTWDVYPDTWVATDGLGRLLPTSAQVGPPKADRTVGIFYFLWLGQHSRSVHDISKLLAENPTDPKYGPVSAFHHWGKPLFDYYKSDDRYVIRKHAQMLTDAGVDVFILDVTNAVTYDNVVLVLCGVLDDIRKTGQRTPQICFIAHSKEAQTVSKLYETFYAKNLYPGLWFRWQGRPLILASAEGLPPAIQSFFTFRKSWAWSSQKWFGDGKDKWCWVDNHPQKPGWHEAKDKPEQISVCAAQHPTSNIGRSFHNKKQPTADQFETEKGLCFIEQWERALAVDPPFVFVTGWNEWVAQRFVNGAASKFLGKAIKKGDTYFVDQYNQEYSRDIEPMSGGHGDAYYYQLASCVRRYKGARAVEPVRAGRIAVDGRFDDWRSVSPEYRDTLGDPARRKHESFDKSAPALVNDTGRNDLAAAKVSYDAATIYFYVRTHDTLTKPDPSGWMMLFIDADQKAATGWLGYDFVVNRVPPRDGLATLEKHDRTGYRWNLPVQVPCRWNGNELELSIPRKALGLESPAASFDFKWADAIQQTGEAGDFTLNGDVAPNDRYNYRAVPGTNGR